MADDQQLAQESAQDPGLAQLEAMKVPAPAISGGWPRLAVANSPETWATEFVTGLLDIDYSGQSRTALGPWLQAEEAPLLIPGIPASAADKELYATVLDPGPGTDRRAAHRQRRRSGQRTPGRVSAKPSATC